MAGLFLLVWAARSSPATGAACPIVGRAAWSGDVTATALTAPFDVVLETAPEAAGPWTTKVTVPVPAVGVFEWTLNTDPPERRLRARTTATGAHSVSVEARAGLLDLRPQSADLLLLSQELRTWIDGRDRIVAKAEADVFRLLGTARADWTADLYWDDLAFVRDVRSAIVDQAEWLFHIAVMRKHSDPLAVATVKNVDYYAPGLEARLAADLVVVGDASTAEPWAPFRSYRG